MNQDNVGKFMATLRKQKNLTQEQLAEKLGVNNRSVSRWENGHCMPDLSLLGAIAEILETSIPELLNGRCTTKDEMIKIRDSINKIIELSVEEEKVKTKKLNRYILTGLFCILVTTLNHQFGILSLIFNANVDEFVAGALTGLGLVSILLGVYNNNHKESFRQRKIAFLSKFKPS